MRTSCPPSVCLKNYIADVSSLELAGTHTSAIEALETLRENKIDLLFLDINLPKISGLNFLRSLNDPPQVIVTTAYPDYAHEGFDLNVVDYLLKPFSFERFLQAVSKIVSPNQPPAAAENESKQTFTFIKVDKTLQKVDFDAILYIESDRDYVKIVMEEANFMHLQTLKHWVELLPENKFVQVHKSFIINIEKVQRIIGNRIEISDNIIPIGRHYKQDLMDKIDTLS